MTHQIQPTEEQVGSWAREAYRNYNPEREVGLIVAYVTKLAYAAGADHELDAIIELLQVKGWQRLPEDLRELRRPKINQRQFALDAVDTALKAGRLRPFEADILRNFINSTAC